MPLHGETSAVLAVPVEEQLANPKGISHAHQADKITLENLLETATTQSGIYRHPFKGNLAGINWSYIVSISGNHYGKLLRI